MNNLIEFRIFNVGQANCSAIIKYTNQNKKDYKVLFIFDCGISPNIKNKHLDDLIKKIDKETILVLSHPHFDHLCNFKILYNKNIKRIIYSNWFFKNYKSKFISKLTYWKILKLPNINNFSPKYTNLVRINNQNSTTPDPNQPQNDINSKSLVAKIELNDKKILVPGDRLYGNISEKLITKYDHILIPHHCCKYEHLTKSPIFKCFSKSTVGYILSGHNNYGHANVNHLNLYTNIKYFKCASFYDDNKKKIKKVKTAFHKIVNQDYIVIK